MKSKKQNNLRTSLEVSAETNLLNHWVHPPPSLRILGFLKVSKATSPMKAAALTDEDMIIL